MSSEDRFDLVQRDTIRASMRRMFAEAEIMRAAFNRMYPQARPSDFLQALEQCEAGLKWLNDIFKPNANDDGQG
jgi:hypothetical protein